MTSDAAVDRPVPGGPRPRCHERQEHSSPAAAGRDRCPAVRVAGAVPAAESLPPLRPIRAATETRRAGCSYPKAGREGRPSPMQPETMNWFWLNIPLGALIFLAVVGIPAWLVIK